MAKNTEKYINDYLTYILDFLHKSPKTYSAYRIDLLQFADFLKSVSKNINNIEKTHIMNFLETLYDKGISKRSISRKISCIKSFATFLIQKKIFRNKELSSIIETKQPKFDKKIPRIINEHTFTKIIKYIMSDNCKIYKSKWEAKRDVALMTLLYTSGMRISEAMSIKKQDILSMSNFIKVVGKRQKERIIPIVQFAKKYIDDYLQLCPYEREFLFVSSRGNKKYSTRIFQRNLEKARNELGICDFLTPHCFRHSCATALLKNNAQIRKIQELLGHSSLSTTQIYTNIDGMHIRSSYDKIMNK